MMRVFILNLPHKTTIIRRFKCSYNAPFFLLPPLELAYLAGISRDKGEINYIFKDYIGEKKTLHEAIGDIKAFSPDLVVTILGVESINEDIESISCINKEVKARIVIMGYLPTIYPHEILKHNHLDFILMNEPEETYSDLLDYLLNEKGSSLKSIDGLAYKANDKVIVNKERKRIAGLNKIPIPDRDSLIKNSYSEPYFGKPFTTAIFSRGCSFGCIYCVRTYGKKVIYQSLDHMIAELRHIVNRLNIKYIRFMDDTFTINKPKVIGLCKKIVSNRIDFKWICLSRPDTIDEEIVAAMSEAGCKRVYLGIESGSQDVLDFYKKGYVLEVAHKAVSILKRYNIEAFGFLMTGAPNETDNDFNESIKLINRLKLDFVVLDLLMPYPGTALFEMMGKEIDFSLRPYRITYTNPETTKRLKERERLFYTSCYLNKDQLLKRLYYFFRYPKETVNGSITMLRHFVRREEKEHEKFI